MGEGQVLGLALMIHERILVKQKTCILFSIRRSLRRTNIFIRFIIIIQSKFEYLNSPLRVFELIINLNINMPIDDLFGFMLK